MSDGKGRQDHLSLCLLSYFTPENEDRATTKLDKYHLFL